MKYDPLYLFENKRNRFEKFLRRAMGKAEGGETPREGGPAKAKAAAPVQAAAAAMPQKAPQSAQAARAKKPVAAAAAPDLISMATVP